MVLISRRYPFQDGHSCQNKVQGPRSLILDPWSLIHDPWSMIHDPWSMIFDLWSLIHDPWSMIHDGKPLLRGCHSGPVWPVRFRSVRSAQFQSVQSVRFRSVRSVWFRSVLFFYMSNCRVKNAALGNSFSKCLFFRTGVFYLLLSCFLLVAVSFLLVVFVVCLFLFWFLNSLVFVFIGM